MANFKLDIARLDKIIAKTIEAMSNCKNDIWEIAENARKESKRLEEELKYLKEQVKNLTVSIEVLEVALKERKRKLMAVNRNYGKYTQEELKEAYEKADTIRVELAVKREQEQYLIRRRNDLEIRIKETLKTVEKADQLMSHVGVALGYLSGDLQELSLQLEGLQQRQLIGLRIIKAQEEERQRVAREIHDGPAQSMSNVVLKAELCERLLDVDIEKARNELQNLKKIVRYCLQDVRKIIYNLRPMSLDDLGLVPTLQRYIANFQEETGICVSLRTRCVCEEMRSEISLTVFRIIQESLSNVRKHSYAHNVTISLEFTKKELLLYMYDDGRGFDTEMIKVKNSDMNSGFGLLNMKERVELLGGDFRINSELGKGTRIRISIPLMRKEGENE